MAKTSNNKHFNTKKQTKSIMAILFKTAQSQLATKEGNKPYYPRIIRVNTVETSQIAKEISQRSALSTGDVKSVIDNLIDVIAIHLHSSEHVSLKGLGTFRMAATSRGRGVTNTKDVSTKQISLTVKFKPSITRKPDRTLATKAMTECAECILIDK